MELKLYFLIAGFVILQAGFGHANVVFAATDMVPGASSTYLSEKPFGRFEPDLRIYCYKGQEKNILIMFQTLRFRIAIDGEDFSQFEGNSPEEVREQYDNQRTIFSFSMMNTGKRTLIKINPFNQTCIGIETPHRYTIYLSAVRFDLEQVFMLVIGLLLFYYAKMCSQTPLFYYLTGILLGIFASLLVAVYFISKLFPKKTMMYGMLFGGWTLGFYCIHMLLENLHTIIVLYQAYVFWYVVFTGFGSFVICYRLGPPKNARSKDLIKWGLQIGAIVLIYYSSCYREATTCFCVIVASSYYFPISAIRKVQCFWYSKFPPKPKLLTSDEFHEQGLLETTRALEELKQYCSSPESKPWRMMSRLKDPQRFASFIEGNSHLMDDEIFEYETTHIDETDDEDDGDNEDLMTDNDSDE